MNSIPRYRFPQHISKYYQLLINCIPRSGSYSDVFFYTDFDDTLPTDLDCADGCIYMRWPFETIWNPVHNFTYSFWWIIKHNYIQRGMIRYDMIGLATMMEVGIALWSPLMNLMRWHFEFCHWLFLKLGKIRKVGTQKNVVLGPEKKEFHDIFRWKRSTQYPQQTARHHHREAYEWWIKIYPHFALTNIPEINVWTWF